VRGIHALHGHGHQGTARERHSTQNSHPAAVTGNNGHFSASLRKFRLGKSVSARNLYGFWSNN
jgi:hypothetical protein